MLLIPYRRLRKTTGEQADQRHGFNYFDYGYVGKFDLEWIPTFALAFNPATQGVAMQHTDYRQVLRKYTPGKQNPVLSNYNNALDLKQEKELIHKLENIYYLIFSIVKIYFPWEIL